MTRPAGLRTGSPRGTADPAPAIALLRLYAYTNQKSYHENAEATLEVFAGMAEQYGMFAGTYGIAAALFSLPHTQIVIVEKNVNDAAADQLYSAACAGFALNKSVIRLPASSAVAQPTVSANW